MGPHHPQRCLQADITQAAIRGARARVQCEDNLGGGSSQTPSQGGAQASCQKGRSQTSPRVTRLGPGPKQPGWHRGLADRVEGGRPPLTYSQRPLMCADVGAPAGAGGTPQSDRHSVCRLWSVGEGGVSQRKTTQGPSTLSGVAMPLARTLAVTLLAGPAPTGTHRDEHSSTQPWISPPSLHSRPTWGRTPLRAQATKLL